jgi:hypothetical protein
MGEAWWLWWWCDSGLETWGHIMHETLGSDRLPPLCKNRAFLWVLGHPPSLGNPLKL